MVRKVSAADLIDSESELDKMFTPSENGTTNAEMPPDAPTIKPQAFTERTDFDAPKVDSKPSNTMLRKGLEKMYANMGTMIFIVDPMVGTTILNQSAACAASLDELAKTNPKVRAALMRMMETNAYGAVLAAHLPIAVAIATKYVPELRRGYESAVNNLGTDTP